MNNKQIVEAYAEMFSARLATGNYVPYFLTFMFEPIPGSPNTVRATMQDAIERVYKLISDRLAVRNPKSPTHLDKRPLMIACPDWPVPKHLRSDKRWIVQNNGEHAHAPLLMHKSGRRSDRLDDWVKEHQDWLIRWPLLRTHVVKIAHNEHYVVEYGLKQLVRGRASLDDILVLPRSMSETKYVRRRGDSSIYSPELRATIENNS